MRKGVPLEITGLDQPGVHSKIRGVRPDMCSWKHTERGFRYEPMTIASIIKLFESPMVDRFLDRVLDVYDARRPQAFE